VVLAPEIPGRCNAWAYSDVYDEEMRCDQPPGHAGEHHYIIVQHSLNT
jgi:hypothetical protein